VTIAKKKPLIALSFTEDVVYWNEQEYARNKE
jgi:hypothetical protein